MKILLLGKNGQVGWQLQRALAPLGEIVALERKDAGGDLADPQGLAAAVRAAKPQVIVNAAAYTAVDKAESEPQLARLINTEAPAALAREAAASGALLVHYSTDYVFDGSGSAPWQESDATGPLNVYGATKLAGEQAIAASGCAHLTFRTSWVYAAHGDNFIKTMLRLAATRERLTVIDDQKGAPTGAELIADVTAHAISQTLQQPAKAGLYHLTAAGEASWFDYAQYVLALARQARPQGVKTAAGGVQPIASSQYPAAARRPLNSRLDTRRLQAVFGLTLPHWQAGVARVLEEIIERGRR
ncbi:MAG: dTDP-4-dehydrorhamnose reductase [Ottowia sp.]|jgi:dTDP-4-dehydrorhamnose reductase|uniref:dTDP-4-dehydrorhamnose reductase n=1 Tax=Ottowia massiliensis TaxID=2045302 RepID=UPI000C8462E1|nr:dTDP-4-dehydrorhamnose reductase [Ottowia massiliensis]